MRRGLRFIVLRGDDLSTISGLDYEGSTFFSVLLEPSVLVWPLLAQLSIKAIGAIGALRTF